MTRNFCIVGHCRQLARMDDQVLARVGLGPDTKCLVCGKVFSQSRNARRHYNEIHLDDPAVQHSCTICGRSYARYRHYKTHMFRSHQLVVVDPGSA
jgi:uncharacterized Zn-finger protein